MRNEAVVEQKDGRAFLINLINTSAEAFLQNNLLLDRIESGESGREEWKRFAVQRYLAALPFERLLSACRDAASRIGDKALELAVVKNLQDETGENEVGEIKTENSHATWRRDFYTALGISDEDLDTSSSMAGTREYDAALNGIIESGDVLVMAGALLALEGTIPREFARMKRGRDALFSESFVEGEEDSEGTKMRKAKARLYLDDHILHDARSHYPDLLNALEPHVASAEELERIRVGIDTIVRAKRSFYEKQTA